MDYRKLCISLFGTDDVEKLRHIAKKVQDNRGAGRKRKFTETEIEEIEALLANGVTVNEIAEKYGTSRQIVSKYINRKPPKEYTMRMTYMYLQYPCTVIDVDFQNERVTVKNRTDDVLHRAFGAVEQPTWQQFEAFLQDRCFPKTRGNLKTALRDLGLHAYDPLQIIEKTEGRMADDNMWIKCKYYPREEKR